MYNLQNPPEFLHSVNRDYFNHWCRLPRNGLMPNASSFRPENVPGFLPHFAIYELITPDFIKTRLVGTDLVRRYGFDATGTNYLDIVEEDRRPKASAALFAIVEQPCGMRVVLTHSLTSGQAIQSEAVGMPMLNDRGGAPLTYFTTCQLETVWSKLAVDTDRTRLISVDVREYIDIGNGRPDFAD